MLWEMDRRFGVSQCSRGGLVDWIGGMMKLETLSATPLTTQVEGK
jgi:hypothetical protein